MSTDSASQRLLTLSNVRDLRVPQGDHKGIILLFPRTETHWAEMQSQYRMIEERTRFLPVLLLATPQTERFRAVCDRDGLSYVAVDPVLSQDRHHFPRLEAAWRALTAALPPLRTLTPLFTHDRIAHSLPVALLRMRRTRQEVARLAPMFRSLIEVLDPFAILVSGDRELGAVPLVLRAADELDIPTVIAIRTAPSMEADYATRTGEARFLTRLRDLPPLLNLLAARKLPRQCADARHRRILFSPGWLTLTLDALGMISQRPWCQGNGKSRYIFVMGPEHISTFGPETGVPRRKLVLIGELGGDALHRAYQRKQAIRGELLAKYRCDPSKPVFVMSVPTFAEHGLMSWPEHRSHLEAFSEALAKTDANVLWSLHPRSTRETYQALAERHGFAIVDEPLAEVLPAGNLFLCGSSTTIEWAVLCGIPVLNIDYAGLNLPLWERYGGVLHVPDVERLAGSLKRIAEDPLYLQSLVKAQREAAKQVAEFDGRASQRFIGFLERLRAGEDAEAGPAVKATA